ncbi:hypothetical protein D3C76_1406650 [compost metagenome]
MAAQQLGRNAVFGIGEAQIFVGFQSPRDRVMQIKHQPQKTGTSQNGGAVQGERTVY